MRLAGWPEIPGCVMQCNISVARMAPPRSTGHRSPKLPVLGGRTGCVYGSCHIRIDDAVEKRCREIDPFPMSATREGHFHCVGVRLRVPRASVRLLACSEIGNSRV